MWSLNPTSQLVTQTMVFTPWQVQIRIRATINYSSESKQFLTFFLFLVATMGNSLWLNVIAFKLLPRVFFLMECRTRGIGNALFLYTLNTKFLFLQMPKWRKNRNQLTECRHPDEIRLKTKRLLFGFPLSLSIWSKISSGLHPRSFLFDLCADFCVKKKDLRGCNRKREKEEITWFSSIRLTRGLCLSKGENRGRRES